MDTPGSRPAAGATGALAISWGRLRFRRETLLSLARSWWAPAALGAIVVLAAVVRLYDLAENPPGFFTDEASYGYNAYSVLHTGKDEYGARLPLFFKAFGEYKMAVFTYSQIPFIAALGLTETAVRLTTATYGILTVVALYLLIKALFRDEGLALCSAAILAILPWHIHYSRTGLGEIGIFPFFLAFSLYLFVQGTRRPGFLLAAGASFGLTLYSYRAAWVILPLLLPILAVLYWRELLRHWQHTLVGALILALSAIPIGLHLLSVDTDRAQDQSIFTLDLSTGETIKQFFTNYREHFTRHFLLEGRGEENLRHVIPGVGWLYWWQVPFIILGSFGLFWRPSRPKLLVLSLLALFPVPAAVTVLSPGSARSILGTLAFSIVTAFGVVTAARLASGWAWRANLKPVALALAGGIVLGTTVTASVRFASFLDTYHGQYQRVSADFWGWQWGPGGIMDRFLAVEDQYDQLVMDGDFNAPEIFFPFYAPGGCEKCTIGNWGAYDSSQKQLFALRPSSLWLTYDYDVKGELYYPDSGALAFLFLEITGTHNNLPGNAPNADVPVDSAEVPVPAEFSAANQLWTQGAFSTAVAFYDSAISISPDFALSYYNRGNAWAVIGIYGRAIDDYRSALGLDPNLPEAINNMGNAYIQLAEYETAKNELGNAILMRPDFALAYVNRGTAFLGLKDYGAALADLDAAVRLDPSLAMAYARRATAHRALGNLERAKADYDQALQRDAANAEALAGRGDVYRELGQYSLAMGDLDRAVELDRDYGLAYARRGIAALYVGDSDRAVADLAKAVELDRDYRRAPRDFRNPLWSLGDTSDLSADLEQAASSVTDQAVSRRLAAFLNYLKAR